jgi:hypothetical protein
MTAVSEEKKPEAPRERLVPETLYLVLFRFDSDVPEAIWRPYFSVCRNVHLHLSMEDAQQSAREAANILGAHRIRIAELVAPQMSEVEL